MNLPQMKANPSTFNETIYSFLSKWDKFVEEKPMNIETDSERQHESIILIRNALCTDLCAEQKMKYFRTLNIDMKSTLTEKLTIISYVQFNDPTFVHSSCQFIQTALLEGF